MRVDLDEQGYEWVRERLLARHFGPGEKLSLQTLADELGVSRSPVHQALTRLVSEGLVTAGRRGYEVRPITPRLMQETQAARVALGATIVQVLETSDLARARAAIRANAATGKRLAFAAIASAGGEL